MPVEQTSSGLERIVSLDAQVEVLGTGYVIGEGPLWMERGRIPVVQRGPRQPAVEVVRG